MAWTQTANIRGASGASGAQGASGVPGATGPTGATGPIGATGPAGTTTWSGITDKPAVIAAGTDAAAARNVIAAEYTGNKGVANGYAALDSSGLVPSSQLPSFVDDVVEAANLAAFPATGDAGKIYTALDTNKVYRWGGSSYTEISPSPGSTDAVPEGSTNLYYTAARADGRITAAVGSSVQAYSATLTTYAGKTAPTGAVVGTTDTQTLTNKTISGASNTVTNLGVGAIGASGTPSSSNFLRGDGAWSTAGLTRSIQTISSNATLGASASTDYVIFSNIASIPATEASGDSSLSSVTALLPLDGANDSTVFTDSSPLASNWVATGAGAKLATASKKYGTASLSLASGSFVRSSAAGSNFTFGTAAWTIEFFLFQNQPSPGFADVYYPVVSASSGTSLTIGTRRYVFGFNPSTEQKNYLYFTTPVGTIVPEVNPYGAWNHVAVCRSGTSTRLFLNGTQVGSTQTDSTNYASTQFQLGGANFDGFVDEVRITKGVARYTTNFTPPTAAHLNFFNPATAAVPPQLTLPTAVGNINEYRIKNIHSADPLVIATTSSQTIDGASTLTVSTGSSRTLFSDSSNWRTV